MATKQKTQEPSGYAPPYFGAWLRQSLVRTGVKISDLEARTGITHSSLERILGPAQGLSVKIVRPRIDTLRRIAPALVELGVIEREAQAWEAAGYRVPTGPMLQETTSGYTGDSLKTFVEAAGYDLQEFDREDIQELQESIETLIIGYCERKRHRHNRAKKI